MAFFAGLELNPGADIVAPVVDWINAAGPGYGADSSGVADATAAIQSALDAAGAAGGRVVYLPAGSYKVSNITVDSKVTLMGDGPASVLTAKAGASGYMIALKHPASSYQATIRDLALSPATGTLGGIQLDNTGFTTGGGRADPLHVVENVQVFDAGGDAFYFGVNARSVRVLNCAQYGAGGAGFNIASATDSFFSLCISGGSGGHGFAITGGNNLLTNCKAFYAGYTGAFDTTHSGFYLNTVSWITLVNCSSQQNGLHGFDMQTVSWSTITGCEADTNAAGSGSTGVGINTNGCRGCAITANSGTNNAGLSPGAQLYGIQVNGTQNGTIFCMNTIDGGSGKLNYVGGGGYLQMDADTVDFSQVSSTKLAAVTAGTVDITTAGSGLRVKEGSNCKQGTAALTAGSVVVANTSVTATSRIFLTSNADGGTPGWVRVSARSAGTSFTITSSSGTDTSTVAYEIFEPG